MGQNIVIIVENGQKLTPEEASKQLKEQNLEFSPDAGSIIASTYDAHGMILADALKSAGHTAGKVTQNLFLIPLNYALYLQDAKEKNGDAGLKNCGIKEITLALDNDKAGQEATSKITQLVKDSKLDITLKTTDLPKTVKDPDQLIRDKGMKAFEGLLPQAKIAYEHKSASKEMNMELEK